MAQEEGKKTIVERIGELVEDSSMASSAFAHEVGIDPANFSKKMKGIQPVTPRDIEKICLAFKVSREWLQKGEGNKYKESSDGEISQTIKDNIVELARKLSQNKMIIVNIERENEDILNQLTSLYIQLDKY